MDYFLAAVAIAISAIGLIGCLLPVIPGPPLSYIALLIIQTTAFGTLTTTTMVMIGVITAIVTILDYVIPAWTTRKFGGSRRGAIGATIGLFAGMLFFPPIGIIIGPFIGAFLGEISGGATNAKATKSAIGSFIGFVLGSGIKIALSGTILYMVIREVLKTSNI
jgi:Uncharacterized protein conserved in bacteria